MKLFSSRVLAGAAAAALASLAVVGLPLPASATYLPAATVGDFIFRYDPAAPEVGATVDAYFGESMDVSIPSSVVIDSVAYEVTSIYQSVFVGVGLTSVTIPDTVTSIGDCAFQMNSLTSVTLPDSLTSLGAYAFEANDLTSVTLPDSLTTLNQGVFANNALTSIALPDSLTTIWAYALTNNDLTAVTIPASVALIGYEALTMNPLDSVVMLGAVPSVLGDLIFGTGGGATPVVSYYARYPGYTQPTWTARSQVYASQALVTAYFDAGLGGAPTVIDAVSGAPIAAPTAPTAARMRFVGWSLTDGAGPVLTFPITLDADTSISALWEDRAVSSPATAVAGESFSLTGSGFEPGETVGVFLGSDPDPLTTLTASGTGTIDATPVVPSGAGAGLHELIVTGTVTGTSSYEITVEVAPAPPVVPTEVVGPFTFEYDPDVPETGATLVGYDNSSPDVSIPSSVVIDSVTYEVTAIGEFAFQEMGLTSVTIPDTVTSIGNGAFTLNQLTSVTLPDDLAYLGPGAFAENQLASIIIPDTLTTLDLFVFERNSLTSVTLPETLTEISYGAFNNNHLTAITIPASVASLATEAFAMNPLESVFMKGRVPGRLGTEVFGAGGGDTPVVTYYARYPGYTQPTWTVRSDVYASRALATATFDVGGAGSNIVTDETVGTILGAPVPPPFDGHRFLGWFESAVGGPMASFPLTVTADTTIYAQWETRAVTSPAKAGAGAAFAITGSGFEPGESVEVWLHSDPVLLTTLTASGTGTIGSTLQVPAGTPGGAHQLVFTGTSTGTTANDITVEVVLAETGFGAAQLTWIAILLIFAGAGLRLFVTVRRMRAGA